MYPQRGLQSQGKCLQINEYYCEYCLHKLVSNRNIYLVRLNIIKQRTSEIRYHLRTGASITMEKYGCVSDMLLKFVWRALPPLVLLQLHSISGPASQPADTRVPPYLKSSIDNYQLVLPRNPLNLIPGKRETAFCCTC